MDVTIHFLQLLERTHGIPREFPTGVRFERAAEITPEYARFLYGLVGGDWNWNDRLGWSRDQWVEELAAAGSEIWVFYGKGVPQGYVHLRAVSDADGTDVEILYFGLAATAMGKGLGGRLLEHGIEAAWALPERHELPAARRVWLHTCSLDGPVALTNYEARGFVIFHAETAHENVPDHLRGAWAATGGPQIEQENPSTRAKPPTGPQP